jgi:hypothetical protein
VTTEDSKARLEKIKAKLTEFLDELAESDDLGDQFQVGYYVHHKEVEWLVERVEKLERDIGHVAFYVCGMRDTTARTIYAWLMRERHEPDETRGPTWSELRNLQEDYEDLKEDFEAMVKAGVDPEKAKVLAQDMATALCPGCRKVKVPQLDRCVCK